MTELTDTELRVKCAEAMGYDAKQYRTGGVLHYRDPFGKMITALANYPCDPAAALTLVDKLAEEEWTCSLYKNLWKAWTVKFGNGIREITVTDPSFCRAICRAFLAVKGKP